MRSSQTENYFFRSCAGLSPLPKAAKVNQNASEGFKELGKPTLVICSLRFFLPQQKAITNYNSLALEKPSS